MAPALQRRVMMPDLTRLELFDGDPARCGVQSPRGWRGPAHAMALLQKTLLQHDRKAA
jgi:hypothetical protein